MTSVSRYEGLQRGFWIHSQSWYASTSSGSSFIGRAKEEIWLSFLVPEPQADDGFGADGEVFIRFYELSGRLVPKLEVFHDSWPALVAMPDVLAWLVEHTVAGFTPAQLAEQLLSMGFIDRTNRVNPRAAEIIHTITDGCDEAGNGAFQLQVNQLQLDKMLELGVIYEDTVSDYTEHSNRRHFHPNHQDGYTIVNVAKAFEAMECGEYGDELR